MNMEYLLTFVVVLALFAYAYVYLRKEHYDSFVSLNGSIEPITEEDSNAYRMCGLDIVIVRTVFRCGYTGRQQESYYKAPGYFKVLRRPSQEWLLCYRASMDGYWFPHVLELVVL